MGRARQASRRRAQRARGLRAPACCAQLARSIGISSGDDETRIDYVQRTNHTYIRTITQWTYIINLQNACIQYNTTTPHHTKQHNTTQYNSIRFNVFNEGEHIESRSKVTLTSDTSAATPTINPQTSGVLVLSPCSNNTQIHILQARPLLYISKSSHVLS